MGAVVGGGGIALLILIAVVLILAVVAIVNAFRSRAQRTAALGTVVGTGGTPPASGFSEIWSTAPPAINTGTQATFVLSVNSMQALSGALNPVQGRQYIINVQPSANISIVSVTPSLTSIPGGGSTNASGTISVVIIANSLPPSPGPDQPPSGVIVAKQINDTSSTGAVTASFTVQ